MDFTPLFEKGKREGKSYTHLDETIVERFNVMMQDNPELINNPKVLMNFFVKSTGQVMIRNYFYHNKRILLEVYSYLLDKNLTNNGMIEFVRNLSYEDVVTTIENDETYFRDLNEAINYIKTVGQFYGFTNERDLLTVKAIVIISWICRLSYSEMVEIKRQDFDIPNKALTFAGKYYDFSENQRHFETLINKLNETECEGFPSHKKIRYPVSNYLFKAASQTGKEVVNANNIADAIKRFNREASQYGKTLITPVIIKCSIFEELSRLEKQSPKADLFVLLHKIDSRYNEESRAESGGLLLLYTKWKELFG